MVAQDILRAGRPAEALEQLQAQVRQEPNVVGHRVFLFQLLAVLGRWQRALTQLDVVGELDPKAMPMVQTYRAAIRCEQTRAEVFAGRAAPTVFGEPEPWVAWLLEALRLGAAGKAAEACELRAKALEAAPTTAGTMGEQAFEWIADADERLGPMLEVIVNGRYRWVPFHRLQAMRIEAPADLRDVVWMPAFLTLATGAEVAALIPTRYPGTEALDDGRLQLARRTEWVADGAGLHAGRGQRLLITDGGEFPLMDVRQVALSPRAEGVQAGSSHG